MSNIAHSGSHKSNQTATNGFGLARDILGDDFISPEEVMNVYASPYRKHELANLRKTVPNLKTLKWLLENGYMLIAGPDTDLNLIGVRSRDRSIFCPENDDYGWFTDRRHNSVQRDWVRGGDWLMLRKSEVPDSRNKSWGEKLKLLTSPEQPPNIAEACWGIATYRKVRGVCLHLNSYTTTSSLDGRNRRISVGYLSKRGIHISFDWRGDRGDGIGSVIRPIVRRSPWILGPFCESERAPSYLLSPKPQTN